MSRACARKRDTEPLKALIPGVLKRVEARHRTLLAIQKRWGGLVGKALAAHCKAVSLRSGRLVVVVDRPGDSFVLSYQREQLLERLRTGTAGAVEEIVIRPGDA